MALHPNRSPLRIAMGQRPGHGRQKLPKRISYAGLITCLRCDEIFESWDRRQNRLCPSCREAIAAQPSDEPSHRLPKRKGQPPHGDDG
jgi:hypothetical protein